MWKLGENGVPALMSKSIAKVWPRRMIIFEIQYQAQGTDLRRELVACLLAHGAPSQELELRQPGAVQITGKIMLVVVP